MPLKSFTKVAKFGSCSLTNGCREIQILSFETKSAHVVYNSEILSEAKNNPRSDYEKCLHIETTTTTHIFRDKKGSCILNSCMLDWFDTFTHRSWLFTNVSVAVNTLKNLISEDDTPISGNSSQKCKSPLFCIFSVHVHI